MSNQPKWKFIANLGDATPLQYGGYFIYQDLTGIYTPEAEYITELDEYKWIVYRFSLERFKNHNSHLIPINYDYDWPHPVSKYIVWFDENLGNVASFGGITITKILDLFCSEDIRERAWAYELLGLYFDFENLDNYPNKYTQAELNKKYIWYHTHPKGKRL